LIAKYDRSTWALPVEMEFMANIAGVPQADLERTWNAGIGMVAIVDPTIADLTIRSLAARGMKAWVAGSIYAQNGPGGAALEGNYRTR
jgi:phosphoribosylformylglycinamidine cyclo-ligase